MEETQEKKGSVDYERLERFYEEHQGFFTHNGYKGLFALGVLVRYVMDFQSANISSTPFEKKLKGLKLNFKDMKWLFTEACNKINQYSDKSFRTYTPLRESIVQNMAINEAYLSVKTPNELSYYFTCGLELGSKFKNQKPKQS